MKQRVRIYFQLALLLSIIAGGIGRAQAQFCDNTNRPFGDAQVLGQVPYPPGYPEGVAVDQAAGRVYVASGVNPISTEGQDIPLPDPLFQSYVDEYDQCSGVLLRRIPIQGQRPVNPRAISHLSFDSQNRLYVAEFQQGIIRINLQTGQQELYATRVADLKPCGLLGLPPGSPCSPTTLDQRPVQNEMVFDTDGTLYLTDSFQATIWRIPNSGPLPRTPQIYFQSRRFDTQGTFGPNGIRIDPVRRRLYIAISEDSAFAQAGIYTLPITDDPQESDLHLFHRYLNVLLDFPDGMAVGENGLIYVALLDSGPPTGTGGGVSILRPTDGSEQARIVNPILFDSPACIAFDGLGSIELTNHSFINGNPLKMEVLNVYVQDRGLKLNRPDINP